MGDIYISRVGEDEHHFNMDDIRRGAVRDSGLFPELFERAVPKDLSLALISGVERKLGEHRVSLDAYGVPIHLPPSLLPRALEDSKEEQTNQIDITVGKMDRGFKSPVLALAEKMDISERAAFFADIAKRAGTTDIKHLGLVGDDRAQFGDDIFLDPLYGDLRNHPNAQIREVFTEGHGIPGKRVKEVDGANLGVINSVYKYSQARRAFRAANLEFDNTQHMDTTLCFVPLLEGALPLPEQGLVVRAIGGPRSLRDISHDDLEKLAKGRIFTYDHFDRPVGENFPDWVNLHALKRAVANDQTPFEKRAFAGIDRDQALDYLRYRHSPAAAMSAFVNAMGIPQQQMTPKAMRPHFKRAHSPETVLTTGNFLGVPQEDLEAAFPVNSGKRISEDKVPLTLRNLEVEAHRANAFAVVHPDKYPISDEEVEALGSQRNVEILRRTQTALISSYLTTMSTQAGASQHIGRPHLVDKKFHEELGLYHPDLCNMGLTGDAEKEAYQLVKSEKSIKRALNEYDETTYQHKVDVPEDEFTTEAEFKKSIGGRDLGYVVNMYGSSGGFAKATYAQPKDLSSRLSRRNNVTICTGAGTRSGMKGSSDGLVESKQAGYKVSFVGVRSQTDVSPLEGSHQEYFEEIGMPLEQDPNNPDYEVSQDGDVIVAKKDRIIPRQHLMAEISNATVIHDGGKGTVFEFYITALHNLSVNLTGKSSILSHNRIMPLCVANRDIEICGAKRGIYDVLLEPWRDQAHLIGLKEFKGEDPVADIEKFLVDHAEGRVLMYGQKERHDFDLSEQERPVGPNVAQAMAARAAAKSGFVPHI